MPRLASIFYESKLDNFDSSYLLEKKEIETWSNGELSGDYSTFYENGKTKEDGAYHKGKKNGIWTKFSCLAVNILGHPLSIFQYIDYAHF